MNTPFFVWAEALLLDDDNLRHYYLAGQDPPDPHFDHVLGFYWQLYELEAEAGLLNGAELEYD